MKLTMWKRKKKPVGDMKWEKAADIQQMIEELVSMLPFDYIDAKRLICFRSYNSSSQARARIWSFPKVWQLALDVPAHYVIEILSEKFDHLSEDDRKRILIHELMHIPKTFSGALVPHHGRFHEISHKTVEQLFNQYKKSK